MGYLVVVFAMVNTAALLTVGWYLRECWKELPMYVSTAIQDEVRKQDDRIEKRLAKVVRAPEEDDGMIAGAVHGVLPGRPVRRG